MDVRAVMRPHGSEELTMQTMTTLPRRMYFETVDWATSNPSIKSSPWSRDAPHSGFSWLQSFHTDPPEKAKLLPFGSLITRGSHTNRSVPG